MVRRRFFATLIAMLTSVLVVHVGPSNANRKSSRGGCAGGSTVPVNDGMRLQATHSVLCLVNRLRASHGLRRVRVSSQLSDAASSHSTDMVHRKYFSHVSLGGDSLGRRVRRTGYIRTHRGCALSETLAWGVRASPATLVRSLMDSSGHRRILLERRARDIGVGLSLGAPVGDVRSSSATLVLAFA